MQTSGGRSWTYKGWNGFSDFSLSSIGFFYFILICFEGMFEIYFGGGGLLNRRY